MTRSLLRWKAIVGPSAAAMVVGLVWLGCGQDRTDLTAPADQVLRLQELAPAINVAARHTDRLLAIPGVVGTAVGLTADGRPAVKIFTTEAGVAGLPESLEGVPVAVEVTGMIVALTAVTDPTARQPRPVPIGVSTGHEKVTAGTIGARVKDIAGSNVYALSNNHIYANQNDADIGKDPVLQPGAFDGGSDPADAIGTLFAFQEIQFDPGKCNPLLGASDPDCNIMDAAIAISTTAMLDNATPADDGYGTPNSATVAASFGQAVKKYGRTTKLTLGNVSEINVTVDVCYEVRGPFCRTAARFVDQIAITPGSFSGGGDSGSLIVTQTGNNPVGLLFAGSSTRTIANPIGPVLANFGVTIDGGAAGPPPPEPALVSISVTPAAPSIEEGQTQQFTATGSFEGGSTADLTASATWASSNPAAAIIDASGLATGLIAGATDISASQDGVLSNTATLSVTAPPPPPPPPALVSISVTPTSASIEEGQTQQFTATGSFDDGSSADLTSTATWASSNPAEATIDASGLATGLIAGATDISASQDVVTSNIGALQVTPATAAADVVTINKARYRSRAGRLQVEAQSTDATAVLTAYNADTNQFLGVLADGKLNMNISPSPDFVRVDSDKGGSDTQAVEKK